MTFPAIERLLPHRPPALLLREVDSWDAETVVCSGTVPFEHPLAGNNAAPMWLALEMGAQAGAVLESLMGGAEGAASDRRVGYLVGMRNCTFHVPTLPVGEVFEVRATRVGGAGPLALFIIEAREAGGTLLATGEVSAYASTS